MVDVDDLRALGEEGLAALLDRRPEVLAAPAPVALSDLADRLDQPWAVVAAMRRLDRPTLQVAEVVAALGGEGVDRAAVVGLVGGGRERAVDQALALLTGLGLLTGGAALTLVEPARYAFGAPLDLGPPLAALLAPMTADDLRVIARNLDIRPPGRKAELLAAVSATLRDADRVRSVAAAAPGPVRQLLLEVALSGRPIEEPLYFSLRHSRAVRPAHWALVRGLVLPAGEWNAVLAMPAEVALALRGEGWRAPFDPDRPPLERVAVEPASVDREASASAGALLRTATAVLETAGRASLAVLRGGGVGIRELRRLAKALGCPVGEVKLALSVAHAAGLLAVSDRGFGPSDRYDGWRAGQPPERLAELLLAWWTLPYVPSADPEAAWIPADAGAAALRAALLAEAAREPGTAPAARAALADLVRWRQPYGLGGPESGAWLEATWSEAALVGATGAGSVSSAGAALLRGDAAGVAAGLAGVGAAVRTVTLQADLTAVVAGTPEAGLATLLDSAADRESSGVASVWRFSPGSIRRALDAGHDAEELLARFAEAATAGLPQPLGYLIRDAARRHGRVRGQEAACCLRSDDEAMLAEIAADRRLRALGLRPLAPTVLAGARPLAETLAALRSAGYAPIAESEGGAPLPEPGVTHRVPVSPMRRPEHRRPDQPDPRAVACELLAKANTAAPAVSATLRLVRAGAARLTDSEVRLLAQAIDGGHPVSIDYLSRSGGITRRVIEDAVLVGGAVEAWCRLREDERRFSLGGIMVVSPA